MRDFLKSMLEGSGIIPPPECLEAFNQNFKDAINVEWYNKKKYFEAVFYKESMEYIAVFDLTGSLLEYKHTLPEGFLPQDIKQMLEKNGEIMNVVLRNKGNRLEYEVIIKDKDLNRHLITLSDTGNMLEEMRL